MRKLILVLMLLLMTVPTVSLASLKDLNLVVESDGVQTKVDEGAYITSNGRTMVPLSLVASKLNLDVKWFPETRSATIERDGKIITFNVDSRVINIGKDVEIDTQTVIKDGRAFIPLYVLEVEGFLRSQWDKETTTVKVVLNDGETPVNRPLDINIYE